MMVDERGTADAVLPGFTDEQTARLALWKLTYNVGATFGLDNGPTLTRAVSWILFLRWQHEHRDARP